MKVRRASVAGTFYPKQPERIKGMVQHILSKESKLIDYSLGKNHILGGVVPHAGYMYSGYEAIHLYELIRYSQIQFDTIIILNPNHSAYLDEEVSVAGSDAWETPLGKVKVDIEFGKMLNLPMNTVAHQAEHSAEVQIPFLQLLLREGFKILPICMNHQTIECARNLALSIVDANKILKRKLLVLASSDFSHYVSPDLGFRLDHLVVQGIQKMNTEQIFNEITRHRISVCGFGPIMTLVEYLQLLYKDVKVKVLRQGNSGDITSSNSVVDYFSIMFYLPSFV
ncbi:AmmeMemoRadiSam system protein B [Ancylomarina euxinus]|uniref:MEMO1 family protein DWB61_13525 n=1 Tax=Ancylomarina euxinus TaxID=2283627 RepID=A0A425XYR4_9BACT|nr:AmmeMemoRadiSam system protein B [Ancylomarina euxinus]MCZ4695742.1 AmmeMemoRadiSam system protein B [Ancylomarina euxinus]MUP16195.1 AmmeMemoRadiSam system protein B [Ancylomarina euxinus]RRG20056.1 AmmeMemoRadiSam system protein B [Ancylomarina euxinus]